MNLLLDTQLVLWTAFWPNKIPRQAAEAIERASLSPPEERNLDCLDVSEHRLRGAVSITVF